MKVVSSLIWTYIVAFSGWVYADQPGHSPIVISIIVAIVFVLSLYGFVALWRDVTRFGWRYVKLTFLYFLGLKRFDIDDYKKFRDGGDEL